MIDKYIDWGKYWHEEIEDQLLSLEDYEPKLTNTDYCHIRGMMSCDDIELMTDDCEINKELYIISFGLGHGEDGVSLTFAIGNDDIIKHVEYI